MLEHLWGTGELIDQLAATRQAFGYTRLSGPTPPLNQPQPKEIPHATHWMTFSPRSQNPKISSTNH